MPRIKSKPVPLPLSEVVASLRSHMRVWNVLVKSRIMQANRLQSVVAGTIGYTAQLSDVERTRIFAEATRIIQAVEKGEDPPTPYLKPIILATQLGVNAFNEQITLVDAEMVKLAKRLPTRVTEWLEHPEQAGFGWKSLAKVVGECGDLADYATVAKMWKRMGCAPHTYQGRTQMAKTWRLGIGGIKLPAEEWDNYGYNPRRRAVTFVIGESLLKLNGDGPYRKRYIEARANVYLRHPEWKWTDCEKCEGSGRGLNGHGEILCETCGGVGRKCRPAHWHAMLLATKRLYRNLWRVWNRKEGVEEPTE